MSHIIHHGWHWTLVVMMTSGALLAMLLATTGVASLIGGEPAAAFMCLVIAVMIGAAVVWIGRHRDDILHA